MEATRTNTARRTERKRCTNPQSLQAAQFADALLTLKTASAVAGISESTIYRKSAADPNFPKLIRLGRRCTRIRSADLAAWVRAQAEA